MRKTSKMLMIEDVMGIIHITLILNAHYSDSKFSLTETARVISSRTGINVSDKTISDWLRKFKIKQRGKSQVYRLRDRNSSGDTEKQRQARKLILKAGLEGIRTALCQFGLSEKNIFEILNGGQELMSLEGLLTALYDGLGISKKDIADLFVIINEEVQGNFSVSPNTIESWIKEKTHCELRSHSEAVAMSWRNKKISKRVRNWYTANQRYRLIVSQRQKERRAREKQFVVCGVLEKTISKADCKRKVQKQLAAECRAIKCPLLGEERENA